MKKIITLFILIFCLNGNAQTPCLNQTAQFLKNATVPAHYWSYPAYADFNNDGNKDVYMFGYSTGFIGVSLGNGDGTFGALWQKQIVYSSPCNCLTAAAVGKINNDAFLDIAVNAYDTIYLYNGSGTGSFTLSSTIANVGTNSNTLFLKDFNNDGLDDIFYSDIPGDYSILKKRTNGNYSAINVFNNNFYTQTSSNYSTVADLNKDGNFDIVSVMGTASGGNVAVFYGKGDFTFQTEVDYSIPANISGYYRDILVDFVNADTLPDLIVENNVLLNNGNSFSVLNYQSGINIENITTGYFNCDNKLDIEALVKKTNSSNQIYYENYYYYGNGTGNFPNSLHYEPYSASYLSYYINATDLNGDGKSDLIAGNAGDLLVLMNKQICIETDNNKPLTFCMGDSVILKGTTGADSYYWQPTGQTTDSIAVHSGGNYYCSSTYSNTGCTTTSSTIIVTVNALPTITVNTATVCAGNTTTLTANGASTYTWNTSATGAIITPSPTATTNYTVTGTDANNCNNTNTTTVTVNALPTVMATTNTMSLCVNSTATLQASGATTYTWSTGGVGTTIAISPTVTTTYTVTGTDANACINTGNVTQTVINCTTTNIKQVSINGEQVLIYPNPSTGILEVTVGNEQLTEIKIYDITGRLMLSQKPTANSAKEGNSITVDASGLPPGIYNASVTSSMGVVNKRLVIVR